MCVWKSEVRVRGLNFGGRVFFVNSVLIDWIHCLANEL